MDCIPVCVSHGRVDVCRRPGPPARCTNLNPNPKVRWARTQTQLRGMRPAARSRPEAPDTERLHHFQRARCPKLAVIPPGCAEKQVPPDAICRRWPGQGGAKTERASAEREEMHRKSGHHTVRWNAAVRGSEGWRTPCPGKHGIPSQIRKSAKSTG